MVAFSRIFLHGFSRFLFFFVLLDGGKIRVLGVFCVFWWNMGERREVCLKILLFWNTNQIR